MGSVCLCEHPPTATEVSKHSSSREARPAKSAGHGYQDILDKIGATIRRHRVDYLSKLGALKDRQQFDADLILLNYLPVDDTLHKDENQIGTTHSAEIRHHLDTLVETVCQFAVRARVEQDLLSPLLRTTLHQDAAGC